jgi:ElaB/YqjD/DUF883 family membrane-anchored ribosome-binding protein
MAVMSRHKVDAKDQSRNRFSTDFEDLKGDFAQLREDVTKLLSSVLGSGKNGAGVLKDDALAAVGDVEECLTDIKDRGVDSVERIGNKIGEHSLLSVAIAFSVGFVMAKLLARR